MAVAGARTAQSELLQSLTTLARGYMLVPSLTLEKRLAPRPDSMDRELAMDLLTAAIGSTPRLPLPPFHWAPTHPPSLSQDGPISVDKAALELCRCDGWLRKGLTLRCASATNLHNGSVANVHWLRYHFGTTTMTSVTNDKMSATEVLFSSHKRLLKKEGCECPRPRNKILKGP